MSEPAPTQDKHTELKLDVSLSQLGGHPVPVLQPFSLEMGCEGP